VERNKKTTTTTTIIIRMMMMMMIFVERLYAHVKGREDLARF